VRSKYDALEAHQRMNFRFSGHETFPCRYTWLPKAFKAIKDDPRAFTDEESAMVKLGVGKNMVRAMRFWAQVANVVAPRVEGGYAVTELVFQRATNWRVSSR
jgi:uncharacterized protein DUF4007